MRILNKTLVVILIVMNFYCNSQDYKTLIEKEFNDYNELIENMEFEKSTNYLTPIFFEIISKSELIIAMKKTYNNPAFEYQIINKKISEITDSDKINGSYYSQFTFSNDMIIKFKRKKEEKDDEYVSRIGRIKRSIEQNLGPKNVDYNEERNTIIIKSQKRVYAISENGKKEWKFLVVGEKQNTLAKRILPKELTKGM